ncbi:MAG: hypothetical protein US75_C0007G0002 [Candidatus Woesebacteria bacterium GW2011_GWC1_38_13]|uniref:Uncharacterized protein n=1 Tax=Candidatus Woesebacteria bacterium GW2011_GWC1_38_13 TaxID=1618583 RepID=A0A0G0LUP5_9BACT|nr:MAG: hypothetical protein US75_C0007G0002 [Candidatus Woesebacteria bacterium GW2011_GWC1_38_13]
MVENFFRLEFFSFFLNAKTGKIFQYIQSVLGMRKMEIKTHCIDGKDIKFKDETDHFFNLFNIMKMDPPVRCVSLIVQPDVNCITHGWILQ